MKKPRILLTNDDGFNASGLLALKDALSDIAHLTVVAPANEKSGCAHSITLTRPLRFVRIDDDFYKLEDGTPADCVYLALNALFTPENYPALVISGINLGSNMGEDITYSGTVGAAMEGVIHDIPSIAISQVTKDDDSAAIDFSLAKQTIREVLTHILNGGFPLGERELLNINIPPILPKDCKGVKITQMGYRIYRNDAFLHRNPRGEECYWLGLHPLAWDNEAVRLDTRLLSDFEATFQNYVSITPICLDLTARHRLQTLKSWVETL